jgi:hypothetical protein
VKKGRHRRFEEARALKRSIEPIVEPCPECGADPGAEHASWCLATEEDPYEAYEEDGPEGYTDRGWASRGAEPGRRP